MNDNEKIAAIAIAAWKKAGDYVGACRLINDLYMKKVISFEDSNKVRDILFELGCVKMDLDVKLEVLKDGLGCSIRQALFK